MPLTAKGEKILAAMQQEYGNDRGESIFYASKNAGTISGVDAALDAVLDRLDGLGRRMSDMERKDAQGRIDARVADAAPVDVMRRQVAELERRLGSGDPASQTKWREEISRLKEKIRSSGKPLSGSERRGDEAVADAVGDQRPYTVTIRMGGREREIRITARSAGEAVSKVKASLLSNEERRWATVFA